MNPTMNTTSHATDRALTRIAAAGLSGQKVLAAAADVAGRVNGSVAVLMTTLPEPRGAYWTESNGNQLWAIIRDHRVVTLMLRRDDQPARPDRLRVDRVMRLQAA
ncbi:MAG: hypothetical protein MUE82_06775 [Chloroflexi bacterium]|jgi:hypothetical protein|nr:hypothetical protein [Chloroflexota bacterium]